MSARQVWASRRCKSIERCEAAASRQLTSRPPRGSWKVAKSPFLQKSARERCGTTGTDGRAARKSSGLLLDLCLHVQYMRTGQSLLAVSSPEVGFFSDGRGGNAVEAATAACQSPHWRVLRKATAASWTRDQCVERPLWAMAATAQAQPTVSRASLCRISSPTTGPAADRGHRSNSSGLAIDMATLVTPSVSTASNEMRMRFSARRTGCLHQHFCL